MRPADNKGKVTDKKHAKSDAGRMAKMDINDSTTDSLDYDSMKRKGKHWKSDELQSERKQVEDLDKWDAK